MHYRSAPGRSTRRAATKGMPIKGVAQFMTQTGSLSKAFLQRIPNGDDQHDAPLALVQRKTISVQVADAIRQRILSGQYAASTQLKQERIASEFGVSRIPVREALHQLHSEGFVTLISHKGATVSSVSLDEILELFELRARIETWLLGLAIPHMNDTDLEAARQFAERFTEKGHQSEYCYGSNWAFHAALYAPSGRKTTIDFVQRLHRDIERYTRMATSLVGVQPKADREHKQLIELCEGGDTVRAVDLLELHILDGGRFLVEHLKELRQDGPAA